VYVFLLPEQSNLFRCHYVCDLVIPPENSVRRSILELAIIPDCLDTAKRGKTTKHKK
jgi:hypothetical protein